MICPTEEIGLDVSDVPELDVACGPDTSTDPSAEEYITIIDDVVSLLQGGEMDLSIPDTEIDNVCEVHVGLVVTMSVAGAVVVVVVSRFWLPQKKS